MNERPAIEARGLTKRYGAVEAVRGIDLAVETGEVFGLLGPNGAGKTTTVEILEGLRPRTSGEVSVLGFDPAVNSREVKNQIGVCLQATNLPDKMKTHEALELFDAFYDRHTDRDKLLKRLQLWEKRDAFYKTLSGGQKQRVALALALLNDPAILFLDEPTTGLDPQVRHEIHTIIEELKAAGKTILLTTHYIEEAERLCDRVAIIDGGKIIEQGKPREIQQRVLGLTVVEVTASAPIPPENLPPLVQGAKCSFADNGRTISLQTDEPAAAVVELVRYVDGCGLKLADIHLKRPTLEDVFIELTGKKLRE
ncbi:MAG TPA: ABC transporter ATP-binding protein [Bryobacteraceae bacterium]|jgi:ABC-2 type transport system ATP-binding protein|nr:ABC transporter ATP-binding protein [Bryobacteraceae bacterium]